MSKRIHDANELLKQEVAKDKNFMDIPYSNGGLGTVQKTYSESYGPDGIPGASGKHPQRPTTQHRHNTSTERHEIQPLKILR
ncbi:hypothetical protein FOYG_01799 [Fusarium oxysporum NRRL 32931]|uniref:Uncharacterized protein n=1 Tax=Fusarium oxysporum NRRL 32931 TaxID=660029 RepID=W9J6E8_FUSOX|nr:hypothetical protein FOYG_01799 [Fusarium oxysporum NRRL 32931]